MSFKLNREITLFSIYDHRYRSVKRFQPSTCRIAAGKRVFKPKWDTEHAREWASIVTLYSVSKAVTDCARGGEACKGHWVRGFCVRKREGIPLYTANPTVIDQLDAILFYICDTDQFVFSTREYDVHTHTLPWDLSLFMTKTVKGKK